MTTFKVGTDYFMRSACDHNCVWTYTVSKRTAKTVTLTSHQPNADKPVINCRLKEYDGSEFVKPLGTYSMSPTLRASREVK